jgi:general stress protein 26
MNEQMIQQACRQLMQDTDVVYVSTVDECGYPQTRAMTNLKNLRQFARLADFFKQQQNDFMTYLTTNKASVKIDQIKKNPKACLYYCNFSETHGLAITGKIEIIENVEIRKRLWQDDWIQFYEGGLNGSDYTVLQVKPTCARGWYKTGKFEFPIKYQEFDESN